MPQIIVTTEGPGTDLATEVHRERIHHADVETAAASSLLVERIGWALEDAEELESDAAYEEDVTADFSTPLGGVGDSALL